MAKWKCKKCGNEVVGYCSARGYVVAGITPYGSADSDDVWYVTRSLDVEFYGCSNCHSESDKIEDIAELEEENEENCTNRN